MKRILFALTMLMCGCVSASDSLITVTCYSGGAAVVKRYTTSVNTSSSSVYRFIDAQSRESIRVPVQMCVINFGRED